MLTLFSTKKHILHHYGLSQKVAKKSPESILTFRKRTKKMSNFEKPKYFWDFFCFNDVWLLVLLTENLYLSNIFHSLYPLLEC